MGFFLTITPTIALFFYVINQIFNPSAVLPPLTRPTVSPPIDNSVETNKLPYCVIGAGISGLNIATLLQKKGHKVRVFEKNEVVGGKAVSFRIGDLVQVELGPVLYTRQHYKFIQKVSEFNLTPVVYNEFDRRSFNPHTGEIFPPPKITEKLQELLKDAVKRYVEHRSNYTSQLQIGFLNVSSDLWVSLWDWLVQRNLQILRPIFHVLITVEGYGALEDIAAIYPLLVVDEDRLKDLAFRDSGSFFMVKEGLDVFFSKMARPLTVHLNSEVFRISRENNHQVIFFSVKETQRKKYDAVKCGKVIIAFPPLWANLKNVISNLSEKEQKLLQHVKVHKYTSAAIHLPDLNHSLYFEEEPGRNHLKIPIGSGELVALVQQAYLKLKNVYSGYSWIRGEFNTTVNNDEKENIDRQLVETVNKLSKNATILFRNEPAQYFPHVEINSLRQGFYKDFHSIQGVGGLYYATTLLGFEIMDRALAITEYINDLYF